ncbi:MAG: hypothetical protein QG602_2557 [Verrucomicrobiota bacterium]|nr:hypothetical protein [Verrucomicrobiota bacterium]
MNTPIVHRVRTVTFDRVPIHRPPVAKVLPIQAREVLLQAAQFMPRSQRVTAINKAINEVRKNHPQFFKKEI